MILDILTPGDCMDSYSSREISFGHEINCLQDVLNVLKCEFGDGKHNSWIDGKPLFSYYCIYIYDNNYNELASWWFFADTMELEIHPPIEVVQMKDGGIGVRYPLGEQRYRMPIDHPERVYKTN